MLLQLNSYRQGGSKDGHLGGGGGSSWISLAFSFAAGFRPA